MNLALRLGRSLRRPRHVATVATALSVAGSLAASASAQDIGPVFDMGVLTNTLSIPTEVAPNRSRADQALRRTLTPGEAAVRGLSSSFDGRPTARGDARLTYTPTAALRRKAVSGYISRIQREYPEAARIMSAQFARHDYSKIYSGLMRGAGLRDNDAADAVVAYTLLGWQIANRNEAEVSNARVQAVRRQIAPALATNTRLSAPETRAELGEEMKLLFVTLHAGWRSAQKEGNVQQYSDGIARMWRNQSGRDLRRVALTDQGFSRR